MVGTNKYTQPGYQKGISISDKTWGQIEAVGGERTEATVTNDSDNMIQIKPEHKVVNGPGATGENTPQNVSSGESVCGMVDAIATKSYSDVSYKIVDGNRATVTNRRIEINSFGDGLKGSLLGGGGFIFRGEGWGYNFPAFVKNSTASKNGCSMKELKAEISKEISNFKPFRP